MLKSIFVIALQSGTEAPQTSRCHQSVPRLLPHLLVGDNKSSDLGFQALRSSEVVRPPIIQTERIGLGGVVGTSSVARLWMHAGPDGAVAVSSANGLVGIELKSPYRFQPRAGF